MKLNLTTQSPAFIPFIMAGHPDLKTTFEMIIELAKIGAQAIEIGIPFSDPIADGPINQKAAETALAQGVTLAQCLDLIQQVRAAGCDVPLIVFSYLNPLLRFGFTAFAKAAKAAGVNSVLVVDLPPEEAEELFEILADHDIGMIFLASPTTDPARYSHYQKLSPDFIYYVSRLGVTGVQQELSTTLKTELLALKQALQLPICVGFGISTPAQAQSCAQWCDGVIVGSALVQAIEASFPQQGLAPFLQLAQQFHNAIQNKAY